MGCCPIMLILYIIYRRAETKIPTECIYLSENFAMYSNEFFVKKKKIVNYRDDTFGT